MIELRPYQREAIQSLRDRLREGIKSLVLVLPTGAGKTVIAASVMHGALKNGSKLLFVAHRRELIAQGFQKMLDFEVPDRELGIIMGDGTIRLRNGRLIKASRKNAPIQIASIDTLRNRSKPEADIIFIDECFPAGTIVDGRPIEMITVGDTVYSWNESMGTVESKTVTHVFQSTPHRMVRVFLKSSRSIACTGGHPFYTQRGYIPAIELTSEDVLYGHFSENVRPLRQRVSASIVEQFHDANVLTQVQEGDYGYSANQAGVTLQSMRNSSPLVRQGALSCEGEYGLLQRQMQSGCSYGDKQEGRRVFVGLQSETCLQTHAREESYAYGRGSRAHEGITSQNRTCAQDSRREWKACTDSSGDTCRSSGTGLGHGDIGSDGMDSWSRKSVLLQNRYCESDRENSDRGGRRESRYDRTQGVRREKGRLVAIEGVDRIEILEPGRDGTFGGLCSDGYVYNLEVEGNHNYFAEGLLVHNCHRCLSKSYLDLKAAYPDAIHLGLTATPYRVGGKGLGSYYQDLVVGATPSILINEGFIVSPQVWTVAPEELPDLSNVKTQNGDYKEDDLAEACNTRKLVGSIVEHWKRHAEGRRTVCFPVNIEHSHHIVEDFRAAGIAAEHLDGKTPTDKRDAILARLERGEIQVVSSVGCLSEGWDQPSVKCCILARPTKSTGLYLQQAGRILRPWNNVGAIILDHAGCVLEHGSPSEDREFTLQDTKVRRKSGESTKTCLGCYAIVETFHKTCPACGQEFPSKVRSAGGERGVEHVEGTLIEYSDEEKERERRSYWDTLCKLAGENNYKSGWAKHRFKEKFGHFPPKSYPVPVGRPMTQGEKDVLRSKLTHLAQKRNLPSAWVDRKVEEQARTSRAPEIPPNLLGIGVTLVPSTPNPAVPPTVHAVEQKTLFNAPKSPPAPMPTKSTVEPTPAPARPETSSSNVGRWEV
jgi:DNA repair protein RadD